MARSAAKKGFKQSSTTKISTTPAKATKIPTPWKAATEGLQAYASTLPKDHVYLVHVDRTSISAKKEAFLVPIVLNVIIALGMIARIYYAAPIYLSLLITVFHYDTSYSVDPSIASSGDIITTVFNRTFLFATDYAIFWLIGSWPREFVAGSRINRYVGPLGWKMAVGLEEEEVIVRRGRKWDVSILETVDQLGRDWSLDKELSIKFKVDAAMNKSYISKTGFSLLDRHWDLDYCGCVDAHRFVEDGRVTLDELENCALVYYQNQWLFWRVHEKLSEEEMAGDPKVQNFKQQCTELGLEDVFYRYMEVLQYETNQPGGFLPGAQARVMEELQRLVAEKGVDFHGKFYDAVGGHNGIPGFG